jgi:hypothetical protein
MVGSFGEQQARVQAAREEREAEAQRLPQIPNVDEVCGAGLGSIAEFLDHLANG